MHYAVSHQTAAEIVYSRADSEKEYMGLTSCAVCPECGYTETYIQDTSKIKKLTLDKKEK